MPTLNIYIYIYKCWLFNQKNRLWKKNPACIVTIAGSQSIRAEDTRDLPMFLGTFMVPAVLWNIIGFKMNNCKRVVILMNDVNDRTLGLIQERLEKTFLKKLK